jgi:hypothetical protein
VDNRIFEAAASASPPDPPAAPSAGYPTDGNISGGQAATIPGAYWAHQIGEELRAVIEFPSITPDHTNLTQLLAAIQAIAGGTVWPAFSAHRNGVAQGSVASHTWTKVQLTTEEFDTNNNFDNATNYRFTPSVAGKYLLVGQVTVIDSVNEAAASSAIYKNGVLAKRGTVSRMSSSAAANPAGSIVVGVFDANGTTDYFELYGYQDTGGANGFDGALTYLSGMRIR